MKNLRASLLSSCLVFSCSLSLSNTSYAQLWEEETLPIVLTAVRLKQDRSEVPASVSIIDRRMIDASGIRKIPELFRLIPGTMVGARDGWNYVVSYHGTNYRDSRRMQVLIDGRSVYQPGLSTIDWNDLPITIEDIERIEIVRGPSSASYGANAFLGVINIITRHPADTETIHVLAKKGSGNTEDYRLAHSGSLNEGNYRVTVASRRDDGFDRKASGEDRRDSDKTKLINVRYDKNLKNSALQLSAGYKNGDITDDINDPWITPMDTETTDISASAKLSWDLSDTHQQHFRVDFAEQESLRELTALIPAAFIDLPLYPAAVVLADTNEDQLTRRYDIEFQDTKIWNSKLKTVSGIHFQQDEVESDTYYDGKVDNLGSQIFASAEYKWTDKLTSTTGFFWENQEISGSYLSPRTAINYHIDKNHSLRAVYSAGYRTPDLLETSVDWQYYAYNVRQTDGTTIPGMTSGRFDCPIQSNKGLKAEEIRSQELGYYGNFQQYGLQVDVKIYKDRLKKLISDTLTCDRGSPFNSNYLDLQGAEIEVDYRPNPQWMFRANYAYVDSETNHHTEKTFTPRNIASLLASYALTDSTSLSYARYYTEKIPHPNRNTTFSRSDIKLSQTFTWNRHHAELAYIMRLRHEENSELLNDNRYNDQSRHLITLSYYY
ncbi:TonB-dependent receptor [Spongiibacter sp. KMU-158]|uniref:TonB-dependent receptor n=1 Tax=Spongiibacter pelagi TaxID=2760804 RepID=A0A927BYX9_9GAMM|nr:TonB-dependent receptor [Spongiibacter pelagi]MBD2857604.1 TonB-dependent receptor [Spongiibacter pelagi]